jgi:2-(1,2-epoxy-1,2-dihydrophenyl)acetyl-CoA isomerase
MTAEIDGLVLDATAPVATVRFNRPEKANYIDNAWIRPLRLFFEDVAQRRDIRCVLIESTGRHFMAGGDLAFLEEMIALGVDGRVGRNLDIILQWNDVLEAILALPQPVIAKVQGGVVGAAVGLAAACDLVVAAETAFFSVAHVHHAEAVSGLITYFLPRQIGYKKAMHMALLGDRLTAREAERLGLVSLVVPDDDLAQQTQKLVARIVKGPPLAHALIKDSMLRSLDNTRQQQAALEFIAASKSSATQDWVEGCDAVVKRRAAIYGGK